MSITVLLEVGGVGSVCVVYVLMTKRWMKPYSVLDVEWPALTSFSVHAGYQTADINKTEEKVAFT